MAIEIFCPFCGSKTNTRTSVRPSLLLVQATVNCPSCGQLKAEFIGQLTNVKRAVYIDCPEVTRWEKTEKEQLKEAGKRPLTNEERLNKLKQDASGQKWLFVDEEAEAKAKERAREKTPLERQQELRKTLQELKETVQSLEIFMNSIYWGTMKDEPDEQVSDSLEWLEKGIKELLDESHALANWFKDANKTDYLTACTPAKTTGDRWARIESELYAISEQLELTGNDHHEKADQFYFVANQLHALNPIKRKFPLS